MKLELGKRRREIQRDWYGKRGISLHGFYVVAQVEVGERFISIPKMNWLFYAKKIFLLYFNYTKTWYVIIYNNTTL